MEKFLRMSYRGLAFGIKFDGQDFVGQRMGKGCFR